MVDIETMGNQSYSSIISIGAVEFDIDTGETGRSIHINVDLQSCMDHGLIVNASTIMWWLQQNEQARNNFVNKDVIYSLPAALTRFAEFCNVEQEVWGNSARFDLGILQNAYNKVGKPIPWDFRKERCVRTLLSFKPEVKDKYNDFGVEHDAIDDCMRQIKYCVEIWNNLKNN